MNRENLQKLATFLAHGNLPVEVKFDMENMCDDDSEFTPFCGTVGCAVGFAPFAGITKNTDEDFFDFSVRTLLNTEIEEECTYWDWCFSDEWKDIDNTPLGAAKRIQYLLNNNGVPISFTGVNRWDNNYHAGMLNYYIPVEVKR